MLHVGPLAKLLPKDPQAIIDLSNSLSRSADMLEDSLQNSSIAKLLEDEVLMSNGSAELANLLEKVRRVACRLCEILYTPYCVQCV